MMIGKTNVLFVRFFQLIPDSSAAQVACIIKQDYLIMQVLMKFFHSKIKSTLFTGTG